MFGKGDEKLAAGMAHTLISGSTEVHGDIRYSGELIVEGRVKGNINAEDDSKAVIRVAESGRVEGEICVPSAVINGVVQGDIRTIEHIELAAKASVTGTVYYNLIEMVMGAEVNGNLMHVGPNAREQKRLEAKPDTGSSSAKDDKDSPDKEKEKDKPPPKEKTA